MRTIPRTPLAVTVGIAALLLAGCAPSDHILTPTPTGFEGEGTFNPTSDPVNGTVGINCRELLDDQVVYDWGSGNFALDVDYEPAAQSSAAAVVAEGGLACSWVNLTSSETVDVAVAAPASSALEAARAEAAASGEAAPSIAPDAYFSAAGGVGHLDAFTDTYWITADSAWFLSPDDAAPLIAAAIAALG